jgi:exopolysaccharide production protein ExoY
VEIGAITTLLQGLNTPHYLLPYLQNVGSIDIGSIALLEPIRARSTIWRVVRILERIVAGALLLGVLPILFLASVVIVVISRRSPFVAHQRVGYGGRLIWVLKLRTMWKGDSGSRSILVHRLSAAEAPLLAPHSKGVRVTSRFAAFCRRYSVDELPQLWQVVRGDMALIGPRPLTRQELDTYYGPDATRIVAARPGISGLWQISGRSRLNYAQRRQLDLLMVQEWSISLYLRILLATLPRVLAGKDAW